MTTPYKSKHQLLKGLYIFSSYDSELIKKNAAISANNTSLIKQVIKSGIKPSYDTILAAALLGKKNIVEELLEYTEIFPLTEELFGKACESTNLDLIKYLENINCPKCDNCLVRIIGNNASIDIINYAVKNLSRYEYSTFISYECYLISSAIGTGNLENVKYIYNTFINNKTNYCFNHKQLSLDILMPMTAACQLPYTLAKPMIKYLLDKGFLYNISVLPWSESENNNDYKDIIKIWKLLFNDNNFQGGTDTITVKNNSKFILKINEIFDEEFLKKHNFYIK